MCVCVLSPVSVTSVCVAAVSVNFLWEMSPRCRCMKRQILPGVQFCIEENICSRCQLRRCQTTWETRHSLQCEVQNKSSQLQLRILSLSSRTFCTWIFLNIYSPWPRWELYVLCICRLQRWWMYRTKDVRGGVVKKEMRPERFHRQQSAVHLFTT